MMEVGAVVQWRAVAAWVGGGGGCVSGTGAECKLCGEHLLCVRRAAIAPGLGWAECNRLRRELYAIYLRSVADVMCTQPHPRQGVDS